MKATEDTSSAEQRPATHQSISRAAARRDVLAALVVIGFAGSFVYVISTISAEQFQRATGIVYYPLFICGLLLCASLALLIKSFLAKRSSTNAVATGGTGDTLPSDTASREGPEGGRTSALRALLGVGILVAYVVGLAILGFLISTPALVAALLLAYGTRNWKALVLLPLCTTGAVYLIFYYMLAVQLP